MQIETEIFRIQPASIAKRISIAWVVRWWWIFGLPIFACLIASSHKLAWIIVAAAILLLAMPGVLALVYFNYALSVDAAKAIIPHKAIITTCGIKIIYQQEEGMWKPEDTVIKFDEIKRLEDNGSSIIVWLKSGRYQFVELLASAFKNRQEFGQAYNLLNEKCEFGTKFVG